MRNERRDNGKEGLKVAMKERGSKEGNEEEEEGDIEAEGGKKGLNN